MNQKHKTYHANVNVHLIVVNVIQIEIETTFKCQCECRKQENLCMKEIFGILLLVLVKMVNI